MKCSKNGIAYVGVLLIFLSAGCYDTQLLNGSPVRYEVQILAIIGTVLVVYRLIGPIRGVQNIIQNGRSALREIKFGVAKNMGVVRRRRIWYNEITQKERNLRKGRAV